MARRPVLLITGGSRGIGSATARLAAIRGYDVVINYLRNAEAAKQVVGDLKRLGADAFAVMGDMARLNDIQTLYTEVDRHFGQLDFLVNNAGIAGTAGELLDADPSVVKSVVDLNVTGAILVAQEAARRMSTRRGGRGGAIVNVSSTATLTGAPGTYVWYAASKCAIDCFTVGLAKEVAGESIRVNAVSPGVIDTEIHASAGQPNRAKSMSSMIPIGRAGKAEEVAEAILFLLSDAARYITGANLHVAGGR